MTYLKSDNLILQVLWRCALCTAECMTDSQSWLINDGKFKSLKDVVIIGGYYLARIHLPLGLSLVACL